MTAAKTEEKTETSAAALRTARTAAITADSTYQTTALMPDDSWGSPCPTRFDRRPFSAMTYRNGRQAGREAPIVSLGIEHYVTETPMNMTSVPSSTGQPRFCPNCGGQLVLGAQFCSSCGCQVAVRPSSPSATAIPAAATAVRQPAWSPQRMSVGRYLALLAGSQAAATLLFYAIPGSLAAQVIASAFFLLGGIVSLVFLYKMWKAIQGPDARISPGAAVGWMFIPLFNVVWLFIVLIGWAADYNRYAAHARAGNGAKLPGMPVALFAVAASVDTLLAVLHVVPSRLLLPGGLVARSSEQAIRSALQAATLHHAASLAVQILDTLLTAAVVYHVCRGINKLADSRISQRSSVPL
jgi:hypothetical protein